MFTGIIQRIGTISTIEEHGAERQLFIADPDGHNSALGDSIAVNGVCLTVNQKNAQHIGMAVSIETQQCSTLGSIERGARVNLESALTLQTPLSGHITTGHIDGITQISAINPQGDSQQLYFHIPHHLAQYIVPKGSIAIDGVSLTINMVERDQFAVNIIPYTREQTIAADYQLGSSVNIEIDIIARYLEKLLHSRGGGSTNP